MRRCVWSRNIKNCCSIYIYIYDISSLRVKDPIRTARWTQSLSVIKSHQLLLFENTIYFPTEMQSFIFFRFYFLSMYIWFYLRNLCIFIVMAMYSYYMFMYGYPDWGFSVHFSELWGKCQGKTRKDGARPALFLIFVLFYVLFVLCFSVLLVCVYCTTATGWLPNCS